MRLDLLPGGVLSWGLQILSAMSAFLEPSNNAMPVTKDNRLPRAIRDAIQHLELDRSLEAAAILEPLSQQFPGHPRIHYLLGLAMDKNGETQQAINHLCKAIAIEKNRPEYYASLAIIFKKTGKSLIALERAKDALNLDPHRADFLFLLGDIHMDRGEMNSAMELFSQVLLQDGHHLPAWINLGLCHKSARKLDQAKACFEAAVKQDPQHAIAHVNLSQTLLLQGHYASGFKEFEWRFSLPEGGGLMGQPPPHTPRWLGESLKNRKILVMGEQGFGDALQFFRFLPTLKAMGGEVFLTCAKPLEKLFSRQEGVDHVSCQRHLEGKWDFHIPLMSLPIPLNHGLSQLPGPIPYLTADPEKSRAWSKMLPQNKYKIGLVWRGKPLHHNDPLRWRSATLADLAPLAKAREDLFFISLQKEPHTPQPDPAPQGMELMDADPQLQDFSDTAALMDNLDLVITIDTATAHLAGALGKPVWILLPYAPDWRWTLDLDTTPWYPTSKLFRQTLPNQWEEPISRMVNSLQAGS